MDANGCVGELRYVENSNNACITGRQFHTRGQSVTILSLITGSYHITLPVGTVKHYN